MVAVVAPLLGLGSSQFEDRNLKLSMRLSVREAVAAVAVVVVVDVVIAAAEVFAVHGPVAVLVVGLAAAADMRVATLAAVVVAHFAAVAAVVVHAVVMLVLLVVVPGIVVDLMSPWTGVAAVCWWCCWC